MPAVLRLGAYRFHFFSHEPTRRIMARSTNISWSIRHVASQVEDGAENVYEARRNADGRRTIPPDGA
jgi:hypothetical protein